MIKKNMTFEAAMDRLSDIVERLDSGDAPLDNSLKLFGEGAELVAFCNDKLNNAKLKVDMLFPEPGETQEK